jgi:1,4-dihydroxy-2-naphthoyl-CoA hydrolase
MSEQSIELPTGSIPYANLLGIELLSISAEVVVARLGWAPERCTADGAMHGGALMSLADTAGAIAAYVNLPQGASGTATISSATQFTRALREGAATATARPLHAGRTTVVVETDVRDDSGRLIARVTQTQAVLMGGSGSAGGLR